MTDLIVRLPAQLDVKAAALWYENQGLGLGERFLNEVDYLMERIRVTPVQFPEIQTGVRRGLTHRFPYSVYFSIIEERVEIIAVLHQHQHPDKWRQRL
jgi:toxin ParE1/3/4